jgi:hypothetical protein
MTLYFLQLENKITIKNDPGTLSLLQCCLDRRHIVSYFLALISTSFLSLPLCIEQIR